MTLERYIITHPTLQEWMSDDVSLLDELAEAFAAGLISEPTPVTADEPVSVAAKASSTIKFNPNHDEHGRFSSGSSSRGLPPEKVGAIASTLYDRASSAEAELTPKITELATKVGGKPEGLDYRLKTKESLTRKIAGQAKDHPDWTEKDLIADIKDSVRYTIVLPAANYVSGSKAALKGLEADGYTVIKAKNTWSQPEYHGINAALKTKDGLTFELQFHTAESWDMKQNRTHQIYEQFRTTTDPKVRARLNKQSVALWTNVAAPPNIASFTFP